MRLPLLVFCLVSAASIAETAFRDCEICPEMIVIPGGTYLKGSPQDEPGRNHDEDDQAGPGGAQVRVSVPAFALGMYEISNREFGQFIAETEYEMRSGCIADLHRDGRYQSHPEARWDNTGRPFEDDFPASCIDWFAASAYTEWLSRKTGERYRLPTESEFEYALRAGSTTIYHFGTDPEQLCQYGNVPDDMLKAVAPMLTTVNCNDGHLDLAPVGQFEPNAFGVHDIMGNIWEWLADCYQDSYANAPTDGSALMYEECEIRSIRGGSSAYHPSWLRSAARSDDPPDALFDGIGFRVARDL